MLVNTDIILRPPDAIDSSHSEVFCWKPRAPMSTLKIADTSTGVCNLTSYLMLGSRTRAARLRYHWVIPRLADTIIKQMLEDFVSVCRLLHTNLMVSESTHVQSVGWHLKHSRITRNAISLLCEVAARVAHIVLSALITISIFLLEIYPKKYTNAIKAATEPSDALPGRSHAYVISASDKAFECSRSCRISLLFRSYLECVC